MDRNECKEDVIVIMRGRIEALERELAEAREENKRLAKSRDRWGQRYNRNLLALRQSVFSDTEYVKAVDDAAEKIAVERDDLASELEQVKRERDDLKISEQIGWHNANRVADEAVDNAKMFAEAATLAGEEKARADRLAAILRRVCEAAGPFIKDVLSDELHDASDVSVDVKLCDTRALKAAVASIPPSLLSQADLDAIAEAKKELGE